MLCVLAPQNPTLRPAALQSLRPSPSEDRHSAILLGCRRWSACLRRPTGCAYAPCASMLSSPYYPEARPWFWSVVMHSHVPRQLGGMIRSPRKMANPNKQHKLVKGVALTSPPDESRAKTYSGG